MAGIGFELKRLFDKKGIIQKVRASLYATAVSTGPMILGVILLFGMKYIAVRGEATGHQQDLIIIIITYSLLFALLLSSILSMVLTRYTSDMIFEDKIEKILPSLYGGIALLLSFGSIIWGIFLYLNKLEFQFSLFAFILFCSSLVVWLQIVYITAIKDFRGILIGFTLGILTSMLIGYYFVVIENYEPVATLLAATCVGYGVMLVSYMAILHEYFPMGKGNVFDFFRWIDKFPKLIFIGFFYTFGFFIHLILMWNSPWGEQVHGYFYHAPQHDIPALMAFITTLVTTVNFITSVEVNFYPRYRQYFSLLNQSGSLSDIEKAFREMIGVMKQELYYLVQRQLLVTVISIVIIGEIIDSFGLGFTKQMISIFRITSVGYGLIAISISITLLLLYFSNNRDALLTTAVLLTINTAGTIYSIYLGENFYGYGLLIAGLAMYAVSWNRLLSYVNRLDYFIYCKQPIFVAEKIGFFTRIADRLETPKPILER